ncbi:Type III effector HopPmaJ [hydrothermal vent metagenome]|uniref:Type III effector HopPmaJ n=1 Tax=hydrothermal vent metagenome TaxID=652676 RepID=A0A3B0X4V0_9ZZZZ
MNIAHYLNQLRKAPSSISFENTLSAIDSHYQFTATAFTNGALSNVANENNGSCKIFAFAQLQNLSEKQTLHCFGDYYRKDVLQNPNAENHPNIRSFIVSGWAGITFGRLALTINRAK